MSVVRTLFTLLARARGGQGGFALAELLVVLASFMFVLGGLLSLFDATSQQAPKDRERAVAIREAQGGLHKMTRELRQAYKVISASPTSMYVLVGRATPPDMHVRYDCDVADPANAAYRRCVRWAALVGQTLRTDLAGEVVIPRIYPEVVFTYTPGPLNPTFAKVHVAVPQTGERKGGYRAPLVLNDGFYLRNTDVLR